MREKLVAVGCAAVLVLGTVLAVRVSDNWQADVRAAREQETVQRNQALDDAKAGEARALKERDAARAGCGLGQKAYDAHTPVERAALIKAGVTRASC